jgi:phage shock protein PspC (stress-responsive transcriptional regulator)
MKSTTTINLAQRLITIDTDAQTVIANYLDALKKHFANEQSGDEIYADIENRIAEIMAAQQKSGSVSITILDVQDIISKVGTLDELGIDSMASENTDQQNTADNSANTNASNTQQTYTGPKRLQRNVRDKIVSGLCSGMAQYINIDVVWVRLAMVLLAPTSISIVAYIILSLVVPKNLEAVYANKRLMRDMDGKFVAGVCSGIALYFNSTPWVIRLVFIASQIVFGSRIFDFPHMHFDGFPLVLYIILWIILPKALTPAQKLQMRGADVTAKTIQNQAQGYAVANEKIVHSGCAGIFATGFKAVAWFIIGCILFAFAAVFGSAFIGAGSISLFSDYIFANGYQKFMATACWILVLGVPAATIIYVVIKAIVGGRRSAMPWVKTAAVLWLVGLVCSVFLFQSIKKDFDETTTVTQAANSFNITGDTLFVKADDYSGHFFEYQNGKLITEKNNPLDSLMIPSVKMNVRSNADNTFTYSLQTLAYGANINDAQQNANKVSFAPRIVGDTLFIPSGLALKHGNAYRGQSANFNITLPNNKKNVFDENSTELNKFHFTKSRFGLNFTTKFYQDDSTLQAETVYQMQNGELVKIGETTKRNNDTQNELGEDINGVKQDIKGAKQDIKNALNEAKDEMLNTKNEIKQALDDAKLEIESDDPVQAQKDLDSLQKKLGDLGNELSKSQKEIFDKAKQKLKEAELKQKTK